MKMKFLSLLLVLSLTVGFIPAVASAETTVTQAPTTAATTAPTTAATTAPTTAATTAPTTAPTTAATTAPTTAPTTAATTAPTNTGAMSITVKLCETGSGQNYQVVLTAIKGGKPVYATTNDAGVPTLVTGDSVPSKNYVKLEYPQDDLPTITLTDAKLRSSGNVLNLSASDLSVKIVIAGNSTIESTGKCGIIRESYGDIIILGPKKLTMNCYASAISFEGSHHGNSLTLKDLTLRATTMANAAGRAIQILSGNLTVDNSDIDVVNRAGIAVYLSKGEAADSPGNGNVTISDSVFSATSQNTALQLDGNLTVTGSNVQFSSESRAVYCTGNLSANSSTLVISGRSNAFETVDVGGEFTLRTTNTEITSTNYAVFSGTTMPRLLGEYNAIAGLSRESATPYNETLSSAYRYFYAESLDQPDDPTLSTGTETAPTDIPTEPTWDYSTEPTEEPEDAPATTVPTVATPTLPADIPSGGNSTLFWILAVVMVLGAGGAAAMAIVMFRKGAQEAFEEEWGEETEGELVEDLESLENADEVADEPKKKFSLKNFRNLFKKDSEDDVNE